MFAFWTTLGLGGGDTVNTHVHSHGDDDDIPVHVFSTLGLYEQPRNYTRVYCTVFKVTSHCTFEIT